MTSMQKFKAYFGMVPPSEYEDDYLADGPSEPSAAERGMTARERAYIERYRGNAVRDEPYYAEESYAGDSYRDDRDAPGYDAPGYDAPGYDRFGADPYAGRGPVRAERTAGAVARRIESEPVRPRLEPLARTSGVVRGANALAPERDVVRDAAGKISTLRPADYSEARLIGERFRDGSPVIMDLADMSNDEAKRLVDFAAGLVFALRGSFDKVATKVFLLSPAGIDVSPEERRRLAESGFSNQH
ncbi:MAG: cell division protein SepF [Gordonia sp. (in: high G+C Gram-positive bacteria)]